MLPYLSVSLLKPNLSLDKNMLSHTQTLPCGSPLEEHSDRGQQSQS